jgi:DNA end-binding protein Ku
MRNREHVCIIKTIDDVLVLNRIRFAQEIRKTTDLKIPATKSKPAEIKMATSLISQLTKPFDPSKFKDEYSDKLMKVIHAKAKGKKLEYKPMKVVHSNTKDLNGTIKSKLIRNA